VGATLAGGALVPVAGSAAPVGSGGPGTPVGPVPLGRPGAVLSVGRPAPGQDVTVPAAPFVHLFVARGSVRLGDLPLVAGDALRLGAEAVSGRAGPDGAELLVWSMHASV
jgi:hypothetical protein